VTGLAISELCLASNEDDMASLTKLTDGLQVLVSIGSHVEWALCEYGMEFIG
jgi:hypothetical protein